MIVTTEGDPSELEAFYKHSNYVRLTRIIAYCLKFYHSSCTTSWAAQLLTNSITYSSHFLARTEIDLAENAILGWLQVHTFAKEIADKVREGIGTIQFSEMFESLSRRIGVP